MSAIRTQVSGEERGETIITEPQRATPSHAASRSGRTSHAGAAGALSIVDLVAGYGSAPPVIDGLTLCVEPNRIVAVLGRNGAGKTTLLRAVSGLVRCRAGRIHLGDVDLKGRRPHEVAHYGVGHVPEGRRVIQGMTVADNLKLGAYLVRDRSILDGRLRDVFALFPVLDAWQDRVGGSLSGGEQQMLSIGRALMGAPSVLALDEPLTGLAPVMRAKVLDALVSSKTQRQMAILLVEQNAVASLEIADHAVVLDDGKVALEGSAAELRGSRTVQQHYLGIRG